jgi:predicted transcriptional regulator
MNRIEVEVLKPQAALDAFSATWQRATAGEAITPRLAFGSLRELFSVLTEKRLELMRHVAANEGLNTHQLARQLERDYKNVHADVAALAELGLLEKDDRGGLSAPFDEIVIHAGIRDAA